MFIKYVIYFILYFKYYSDQVFVPVHEIMLEVLICLITVGSVHPSVSFQYNF